MMLDAASAKALAIILIIGNQGETVLKSQYPLEVIDQGRTWLIKGTPYKDVAKGLDFCASHVILRREDAEVIDLGLSGRMILTPAQRAYWHNHMTPEEFHRVFGPRTSFDPARLGSTASMDINRVVNGGLVNTPDAAIDYALVLIHAGRPTATISRPLLRAVERAGVWHVTTDEAGGAKEIVTISRQTGKMLSSTF